MVGAASAPKIQETVALGKAEKSRCRRSCELSSFVRKLAWQRCRGSFGGYHLTEDSQPDIKVRTFSLVKNDSFINAEHQINLA